MAPRHFGAGPLSKGGHMANTREVMGEQACLDAIIAGTITEFEDDEVYELRDYAFQYCSALTSVSLPVCTTVGGWAFQSCSSLATANLPACTSVGDYAFNGCGSLASVNLPECKRMGAYSFQACYALTEIDLPKCSYISGSAFNYDSNLTSITLGYDGVVSAVSGSLPSQFNAGGTGTVYVPASRLAAYQASSAWSNINLAAIEG